MFSVVTFSGVEHIAGRGVFLSLPEYVPNSVRSVGFLRITSDSSVSFLKAYVDYSWLHNDDWHSEGCVGWYILSAETIERTPVPPCSICYRKQTANECFITRKVTEVSVGYAKSGLMTRNEARRAAAAAGGQFHELTSSFLENTSAGVDDKNGEDVEQISDLRDFVNSLSGA